MPGAQTAGSSPAPRILLRYRIDRRRDRTRAGTPRRRRRRRTAKQWQIRRSVGFDSPRGRRRGVPKTPNRHDPPMDASRLSVQARGSRSDCPPSRRCKCRCPSLPRTAPPGRRAPPATPVRGRHDVPRHDEPEKPLAARLSSRRRSRGCRDRPQGRGHPGHPAISEGRSCPPGAERDRRRALAGEDRDRGDPAGRTRNPSGRLRRRPRRAIEPGERDRAVSRRHPPDPGGWSASTHTSSSPAVGLRRRESLI